jgi:hypothetical protein
MPGPDTLARIPSFRFVSEPGPGRSTGFLLALWLTATPAAHAAYLCTLTPQRVNLIAFTVWTGSVRQSLTVSCTRAPADASSLSYRVTADPGLSGSGSTRRVRLVSGSSTLTYTLNRATTAGGSADCNAIGSNWTESGGSNNHLSGTLDFGSALSASQTWEYCTTASASLLQPAGVYADSVGLTLRYPNTSAGQLLSWPLDVRVGVQTACLLDQPIAALTVPYTSHQVAPAVVSSPVLVRCSQDTPWTAGLQGPAAPAAAPVAHLTQQRLLGLVYSLQVSPASGLGQGNTGSGQGLSIQLTVPGGQSGICAQGSCSASATHSLVLTF